ncbi:MAG: OmpA family protein [Salaquimonas sp.]|jgi:outer membrane protein OmpA-like peptidoglycan-associated protein|nr:OmpA family protein [Salaquimonas sp.]
MRVISKLLLAAGLVCGSWTFAVAADSTVSFGDAAATWSNACRADVEAHCNTENPGGGKLAACLKQYGSPACNAATAAFGANLNARIAAEGRAQEICRSDISRFCSNFNAGDARILRCMMQPEHFRAASVPCKNTLAAAGWLDTISIRSSQQNPQVADSIEQLSKSVQKVQVDVTLLHNELVARIQAEGTADASASSADLDALLQLPNFTVQVDFFLNSDIVKPESWVTVGRIADALHHPLLLGDRFLVVGHTDSTGTREHNLELSDRRAAAIKQILVTTFKVPAARLIPLGVGEEQLLKGIPSTDPRNRRVELINLGPS